jgi:phosphoribosylformylglycinamidine synthase
MAKFSEIMPEVVRFAERGGIVLGICNGFQILCEAGLLPGTLIKNHSLRFVCQDIDLQVVTARSRFTAACYTGEILRIPIKHGEGCYFAAEEVLRELEAEGRIILRYACPSSPNGSLHDIAAILSSRGNVLGMMPHPEHASEGIPSSCDGLKIFQSILQSSTSGLG